MFVTSGRTGIVAKICRRFNFVFWVGCGVKSCSSERNLFDSYRIFLFMFVFPSKGHAFAVCSKKERDEPDVEQVAHAFMLSFARFDDYERAVFQ